MVLNDRGGQRTGQLRRADRPATASHLAGRIPDRAALCAGTGTAPHAGVMPRGSLRRRVTVVCVAIPLGVIVVAFLRHEDLRAQHGSYTPGVPAIRYLIDSHPLDPTIAPTR